MQALVIALGVIAALFYALSDFLEQRSAQRASRELRRSASGSGPATSAVGRVRAGAGRLLRDPHWLLGWALGTFAYLVQAAALRAGSVAVVQSLQVLTLLFAIPLSTVGTQLRPRMFDLLAGGAICLGLALLIFARGDQVAFHVHRWRLLLILVVLAGAVVLLCGAAWRRRGVLRATLFAIAAGSTYGVSATMVKLTAHDLTNRGIKATATDWPGYALAVLAVASVVLQQLAFASGRLPTATTAIVVTNPIVGTVVAIVAFGEHLPTDPASLALMSFALVPLLFGLTVLPRSPLLNTPADDREPSGNGESRLRRSGRRIEGPC